MAQPSQLKPLNRILQVPCNALPAIITGGTAYDDTTIKAEIGTPGTDMAAGSIYISGDASTPGVWIAVTTTWTKLTVN